MTGWAVKQASLNDNPSWTQTSFLGESGASYTFRIRATDNVSNVGDWVEVGPVTISAVTKYYLHGGQRVAMRRGAEVYYLHGDHLGSTSLTTDSSGAVVSEVRYLPYGEERWANGETPTDFGFTSQRREGFGLYDYRARFYEPYLNQFISPDPIIPDYFNPQSLNQYAYAYNNPVNNTDPSGRVTWRQASTYEHKAIEAFYERTYEDYKVHREYGQQPRLGTWIDLIYFPAVTQGRFRNNFNFGPTLGEVYEIEPIHLWNDPKGGLNEATKFVGLLKQNKENLWGKGKVIDRAYVYDGWDYDWRRVEWGIGNSFDPTGLEVHKVWVPEQNNKMILVWLQRPGLIIYLDPKNDDHKQTLVTDPEFNNIRYRVVAKASNEFQEYAEQLRNSAIACYADLPASFWDPNYRPKTFGEILDEFLRMLLQPGVNYGTKCAEIGSGCDKFR